jgi:hypothetical protein
MSTAEFQGSDYVAEFDLERLKGGIKRIADLMADGQWRTLREIEGAVDVPAASASAQLRNLRKPRYGSHIVERQRRGDPYFGLFEYRVVPKGGE